VGDEDITTIRNSDALVTPDASQVAPSLTLVRESSPQLQQVNEGPITCRRAKKLQQEVHAFLSDLCFNIDLSHILPKSCTLLLLRII
jgi:hypothetical protein